MGMCTKNGRNSGYLATSRIFIGDLRYGLQRRLRPCTRQADGNPYSPQPPTLRKKREGWDTPHAHSPSVPASLASKVTRRPQTCSDADPSLGQYAGPGLRLAAPTPAKRLRARPFAAAQGFACGLPLRSRPHYGSNCQRTRLPRSVIAASGCPLGGAAAGAIANEAGS
jgi:hypothetical protein